MNQYLRQIRMPPGAAGECPRHPFVVACDAVVGLVRSYLVKHGALDKQGWMSRHPSPGDSLRTKACRTESAHQFGGRFGFEKGDIAIKNVQVSLRHLCHDTGQCIVVGVTVICVEDANYVAASQGQAFVHRVVNALVWLRHQTCHALAMRLDDLSGAVR